MNAQRNVIVWIVLAALALAACSLGDTRLSHAEGATYAAEVEDIVENMLVGRNKCDYARFTRDFDMEEWEGEPTPNCALVYVLPATRR